MDVHYILLGTLVFTIILLIIIVGIWRRDRKKRYSRAEVRRHVEIAFEDALKFTARELKPFVEKLRRSEDESIQGIVEIFDAIDGYGGRSKRAEAYREEHWESLS